MNSRLMLCAYAVLMDQEEDNGGGGGGGGKWYEGFKDPQLKTWVESFNGSYADPEAMTAKAFNLEKLMGADKAGRSIILPKDDAKPEEVQAFWRRLGAAESADGYKVADALKDDPMMGEFRTWAHSNNVPVKVYDGIMKFVEDFSTKHGQTQFAAMEAAAEKEMQALSTQWGKDYDQNMELSRRAAKAVVPVPKDSTLDQVLTKIEAAIGPKAMLEMFHNIGATGGEHGFIQNDGGGDGGGRLSASSARAEIEQLKKDKDFQKKYVNGDKASVDRWNLLHKIAFAED